MSDHAARADAMLPVSLSREHRERAAELGEAIGPAGRAFAEADTYGDLLLEIMGIMDDVFPPTDAVDAAELWVSRLFPDCIGCVHMRMRT